MIDNLPMHTGGLFIQSTKFVLFEHCAQKLLMLYSKTRDASQKYEDSYTIVGQARPVLSGLIGQATHVHSRQTEARGLWAVG